MVWILLHLSCTCLVPPVLHLVAPSLHFSLTRLTPAGAQGRIETSELRDKLRQAQQEGARATSEVHMLASRAESEQESAAVQLVLMRNRVAGEVGLGCPWCAR